VSILIGVNFASYNDENKHAKVVAGDLHEKGDWVNNFVCVEKISCETKSNNNKFTCSHLWRVCKHRFTFFDVFICLHLQFSSLSFPCIFVSKFISVQCNLNSIASTFICI